MKSNPEELMAIVQAIHVLSEFSRYHRDTLVKDLLEGLYFESPYAEDLAKYYGIQLPDLKYKNE